eukprot:2204754-Amphidinium_carterae.1
MAVTSDRTGRSCALPGTGSWTGVNQPVPGDAYMFASGAFSLTVLLSVQLTPLSSKEISTWEEGFKQWIWCRNYCVDGMQQCSVLSAGCGAQFAHQYNSSYISNKMEKRLSLQIWRGANTSQHLLGIYPAQPVQGPATCARV